MIDLFAGGLDGFGHAGRALGYRTLGIEWDDAACATRKAAGLATVQADVSQLDPLDFAPVVGLTGGPPCQAFSPAGKGLGRAAIDVYREAIERMGRGAPVDVAELDAACADERAHLVLEPLRWALALRPRWVACEQVPAVLPLWEAMCAALRAHGYWTWCGNVDAEMYGVPQTRRRAILLASLDGPVGRPQPTHQRYVTPRRRKATGGMFDLLPWVSMAEALGWGMTERPGMTLAVGTAAGGADSSGVGGSGARASLQRERDRGAWISGGIEWVAQRPATTVNGDPRISEPGHHDSNVSGSQQANAVRVSLAEALILQSYPPNYPVQGTKTKQYEQCGNAIPYLLALAVLSAVAPAIGEAVA